MTELFKKERIDIRAFASMNDDALLQKGILSKSVRKKLMSAMKGF